MCIAASRIPAFTPVLLNVSMIAAAIFLAPHVNPPILALAWGVAIGGVAQLLFQLWPLARLHMLPRVSFNWRDEGVRRILLLMGPAILGVSAAQISALINTQLAAYLGNGRISWISYADRLMEFPSALLGVALGTILLPSLSKHHHDANDAQYSELLDWGLRLTFLLALPAALALALLAVPLIATLYHYGRFTVNDLWQTRAALIGYSFGLLGLIAVKILAPGFYARQNMKTPVKIAFLTVLFTQTLAVILMFQIGHAGLTTATSLGACFNATLALRGDASRRVHIRRGRDGGAFLCASPSRWSCLASCCGSSRATTRSGCTRACGRRVGRLAWVIAAGTLSYFARAVAARLSPRRFQPPRVRVGVGLFNHRAKTRLPSVSAPTRHRLASLLPAALAIRTRGLHAFRVQVQRVLVDFEAALARDLGLPLFDLGVEELLDAAALQAHEVIVVAALIEFEHGLAGLEMMTHQQPGLLELRQHAVDRGEADVEPFGEQLPVDVLGGQVPHRTLFEEVDDLQTRQRCLEAGGLEVLRGRHGDRRRRESACL